MSVAQTMTGPRAKVTINGKLVGIFTSCTYGMNYDMQPIFILGRVGPAEIVPTGQEAISFSATGFRIVGRSPHVVAGLEYLQNLLSSSDFGITLEDRQTKQNIGVVEGCRAVGYNTGLNARGVQEITVNFIGLRLSDESGTNSEAAGATNITDFS